MYCALYYVCTLRMHYTITAACTTTAFTTEYTCGDGRNNTRTRIIAELRPK